MSFKVISVFLPKGTNIKVKIYNSYFVGRPPRHNPDPPKADWFYCASKPHKYLRTEGIDSFEDYQG